MMSPPGNGIVGTTWWSQSSKQGPAGSLLVLDVFEHPYTIDYGLKKADYTEAFFRNLDWRVVANRLSHAPKVTQSSSHAQEEAMGAKHSVRIAARRRKNGIQGMLLMTRRALMEEIQKDLGHYRVTPSKGSEGGKLYRMEEAGAVPDAEIEFAIIDQRAEGLRQLDLAVERLKAGAYGICEDCGREISTRRIKALPSASRCTMCQERWEASPPRVEERRPLLAACD